MQENNYLSKTFLSFHVVPLPHLKLMKYFKYVLHGLLSYKQFFLSALLFIKLSICTRTDFLLETTRFSTGTLTYGFII